MTVPPITHRHVPGAIVALVVRYVRTKGGVDAVNRMLAAAGEKRSVADLEDRGRWSSHAQKVALLEAASKVLSEPRAARHIGASAIDPAVRSDIKSFVRSSGGVRRAFERFSQLGPFLSNTSTTTTITLTANSAELAYQTTSGQRPHGMDCDLVAGLLAQVPTVFGSPPASVEHDDCQAKGAERCVFEVKWRDKARLGLRSREAKTTDIQNRFLDMIERAEDLRFAAADLVAQEQPLLVLDRIVERATGVVSAEAYLLAVDMYEGEAPVVRADGLKGDEAARLAIAMMEGDPPAEPTMLVADIVSSRKRYGRLAAIAPTTLVSVEEERELLEAFARHAAVALDVATSLDQARTQGEAAAVLLSVARGLAEATTLEEVLSELAGAVPEVVGAERGAVLLWDEQTEALVVRAAHGFAPEMDKVLPRLVLRPQDTNELKNILADRSPRTFTATSTRDPYLKRFLQGLAARSCASVPVFVGGRAVGLICAFSDHDEFKGNPATQKTRMLGLADQAANAIENARLAEKQHNRAEGLRNQAQILEMVARGADLRQTFNALALMVEQQLEDVKCAVLLVDNDGKTLQTVSAPTLPREFAWALNGVKPNLFVGAGATASGGGPVYVTDITTDPHWWDYRDLATEHGLVSCWSTPILSSTNGLIVGALVVYRNSHGDPGEDEHGFLNICAQLGAFAIQRKGLQEQLTHQAFHDALTGLPNRVLFADRVDHALARSSRQPESIAVLFIDLDDFKTINDSLGHQAGDELLRVVAVRLKACLRAADTAARLGGDEFAVLLEGTDRRVAMQVAERILISLREPILLHETEIAISGSVGVAFARESGEQVDDLLRNADAAMYAAKAQGKGCYEIFQKKMRSGVLERLELQAELQGALDRNEVAVHYQPIYRLDPLEIVGVEALVRWEHPTKGIVSPAEFIPIAEDTGLIVPIGMNILEQTCAQIAAWQRQMPGLDLRAGVNFSARQLQQPTLVEEVAAVLQRNHLDPRHLIIEITESVFVRDPEDIADRLAQLSALGVSLAIDDFGTGYSSLSYLRRFPVKILKIDKFFIKGMDISAEESAYARAIVSLGHSLGLEVIAEGIESPGELEQLREVQCDFGQGYMFAEPMTAPDFELLLLDRGSVNSFPPLVQPLAE